MKKYSIAFWGWAARWLVHIWVIKYIEENKVLIKEISWTSMWAIIWSLFAIWKNHKDIIKIAKELNFLKLIDFWLSFWFIKWNRVIKKLDEVFWDILIEDLDIDLKIVATNLESWEREVFKKWKIVDALRASISLPWVFMPYEILNKTYIDWWITNNLPVDVLEWKNIIGVSALKKITWKLEKKKKFLFFNVNKSFIEYNYSVLHRSILIMMQQNELRSIEKSKKSTIIIQPNFWNLDYYSFDKVDEFVKLWYKEAKKSLNKL